MHPHEDHHIGRQDKEETAMSAERGEWIARRAYALWEADGRQHGKDRDHWEQAARERDELERVALPGHLPGHPDEESDTPPADEKTKAAIRKARERK